MKFKVGDKVRVKSQEELEKCVAYADEMSLYCGQIVTIGRVNRYGDNRKYDIDYNIKEDDFNYLWDKEMFEDEVVNDDNLDALEYSLKHPVLISLPKITKIMLIEDGSIYLEKFEQGLLNMGIQPIVYRKGANPPKIIDLEKTNE